jgi:SAM-dependent methyltransferase
MGCVPIRNKNWLSPEQLHLFTRLTETRHLIVFPWLLAAVKERAPQSLLDFGAGDGRLLFLLRENFDFELWYYDPSQDFQSLAGRTLRDRRVQFVDTADELPTAYFDLVVSIAVWMTIPTHSECVAYLRHQYRMLKPGGRSLIVVTHPCFREEKYSSFHTGFNNIRYLESGTSFETVIQNDAAALHFVDYHWNLGAMIRQAEEAGFCVAQITEFPDIPDGNQRGCPWLCWEFQKVLT